MLATYCGRYLVTPKPGRRIDQALFFSSFKKTWLRRPSSIVPLSRCLLHSLGARLLPPSCPLSDGVEMEHHLTDGSCWGKLTCGTRYGDLPKGRRLISTPAGRATQVGEWVFLWPLGLSACLLVVLEQASIATHACPLSLQHHSSKLRTVHCTAYRVPCAKYPLTVRPLKNTILLLLITRHTSADHHNRRR